MIEKAIEQKCKKCGDKFTTFDPRVKLCMDCYYSGWNYLGRVTVESDILMYPEEKK